MVDDSLAEKKKALRKYHSVAMELAEKVFLNKHTLIEEELQRLRIAAYCCEREAAYIAQNIATWHPEDDIEPTRTVLFRSAASLAIDCGFKDSAKQLIDIGLNGVKNPSPMIIPELRELLVFLV